MMQDNEAVDRRAKEKGHESYIQTDIQTEGRGGGNTETMP